MTPAPSASVSQPAALPWRERGTRLDPRYLIALLITVVLVAAQFRYHMVGGYFAITTLLLAAPDRISVLSHQWGNDLLTNVVIWCFGLVITARVGVLHITLAYVSSFLVLNGVRSGMLGQPLWPEIAPITGPMYQLFVFFMITDPRTVVRARGWQVMVAVLIALVEALIRFASDQAWALPTAFSAAPPIVALALVGPVAKWIDLRRTPRATEATAPAGSESS